MVLPTLCRGGKSRADALPISPRRPNSNGWRGWCPGRLKADKPGYYAEKHGFGHEDWNFNFDLCRNGKMLGFAEARPSRDLLGEKFCVLLAEYVRHEGWRAAGYYDGAVFREGRTEHLELVAYKIASDLHQHARGQLSPHYNAMTEAQLRGDVLESWKTYWEIPADGVLVFKEPVRVNPNVYALKHARVVVSHPISPADFEAIVTGGSASLQFFTPPNVNADFSEGKCRLQQRYKAERSDTLLRMFKRSLHSFACEICAFDFETEYGPIGKGFIEAHHLRPVSKMNPDGGDSSTLADFVAACPNCHRMLHMQDPPLTPEALREMMKTTKPRFPAAHKMQISAFPPCPSRRSPAEQSECPGRD